MSEQLKQQTLYDVAEANVKNLIWVDVYVSGTEGSAGVYATRRMTKAQLITFLNSNLSVAWSTISSKPTTVSGFGITDAVDTTGGTANYVAKFTDANTIEESLIQDNGTNLSIGDSPLANSLLYIRNVDKDYGIQLATEKNAGKGATISASGVGGTGAIISAQGSGGANIGASIFAINGSSNYALQLQDGTEVAGRFLKCIDLNGKANWASITESDISGFGTYAKVGTYTDGYVTRWNAVTNTLENSLIRDNGTVIGVNTAPNSTYRWRQIETAGKVPFRVEQSSDGLGVNLTTGSFYNNSVNTAINYGTSILVEGSTSKNIGQLAEATSTGGARSVGAKFTATGGTLPRAVELQDGTEASGKILKCIDADGGANWTYLPVAIQLAVSDEITALTIGTGKITFRMPHAMTLTEVRASLTTAQTSGSILTIDVNESGSSVISTKVTIDNTEKTSTTAVISDSSLADDAEITIDIDQVGDGTAKGLKITLIGTRSV
jgi:hypothetical protein